MSDGLRIAWRAAVILVLGAILASLIAATASEISDYLEEKNYGQSIEDYDRYLYEGEYGELRRALGRANPRGEEFKPYWDVADAYWCYELYEFWQQARESGALSEEEAAAEDGGGGNSGKYRERLLHIYENSGEQARRYIRSFAGALLP